MSREVHPLLLPLLGNDVIYPFLTVEMQFDSQTLYFWTGHGQLVIEDKTYIGTSDLLSISEIEETAELAVSGATLSLAGLNSSIVALALDEPYQGRPCIIQFGAYTSLSGSGFLLKEQDNFYILLEDGGRIELEGDIAFSEIFSGYMDTMDINEGVETSTIAVGVTNKLVDLERPRIFRYNTATQQQFYPEDRGFDFVTSLADKTIYWGSPQGT